MRQYNVLLSVPMTVEIQVEAESEDVARFMAVDRAEDLGPVGLVLESDCVSSDEITPIEAWELYEEAI
jgi:hypothetical protein